MLVFDGKGRFPCGTEHQIRSFMEYFRKLRRKFHIEALLKGIALGVSVGLIAMAVTWIAQKRSGTEWNIILYLLFFAGVSLLSSVVAYAILRPTDKRVARRIDKRAGLKERTQTMRQFASEDGEMILLQRQDTERRIAQTPKAAFKAKRLWIYAVAGALAGASVVTAALVPKKTVSPTAEPPQLEYNEEDRAWDLIALENLIKEVKDSDMQKVAKDLVVAELETLLADLQTVEVDQLMRDLVIATITDIDDAVEGVNTYREFAESINKSVDTNAQRLSLGLAAGEATQVSKYMTDIRAGIEKSEEAKLLVKNLAYGINEGVKSSGVADTDELYQRLAAFVADLEAYAEGYDRWPEDRRQTELEDMFIEHNAAIGLSIEEQRINAKTRDYVIDRLKSIFGISDAELKDKLGSREPMKLENIPQEEDEKFEDGGDGGMGTGETLYGSNEQIYDPTYEIDGIIGNHVAYGQVLDKYSAIISANKGELPKEIIDLIDAYLNELNKTQS